MLEMIYIRKNDTKVLWHFFVGDYSSYSSYSGYMDYTATSVLGTKNMLVTTILQYCGITTISVYFVFRRTFRPTRLRR